MNMNAQQMCMICHQTGDTIKLHKLRQMLSMCRQQVRVKPNRNTYENLQWAVNSRCKYGIPCQKLKDYDRECKELGRQLEPYMKAVATEGNSRLYHNLLSMLRGDFPMEHRKLEEMHLTAMLIKKGADDEKA